MSDHNNISIDDEGLSEAAKALRKIQELKQPSLANDIAFLGTHTFACLLTDFLTIPASDWLDGHTTIEWKDGVFNYSIHKERVRDTDSHGNHLLEWAFGEGIGDMAAIPITAGLQSVCPQAMQIIGKPLEMVFGGYYRNSAEKAADKWAERFDIETGSKEHYDYKEAHYNKEIAHLPHIAVWTITSMLVGAYAQKNILPYVIEGRGNDSDYSKILIDSIGGKVITAMAANIPRLVAPHSVDHIEHELGEFVDRHISPTKQKLTNINNDGVITPKQQLLLQV